MATKKKPLFTLRKTPSQGRSQHTVEVILDAAAQVLEADAAATTNHIAARAGFSIGTLYQYFPNRNAVLAALAAREQTRILAGVASVLRDIDPQAPDVALRGALRLFLHAFQSRRTLRRQVLLTLLPNLPDLLRGQVVDAVLGEVIDILQAKCGPRIRPLDQVARFVATRAVMGVVRAAVIEGTIDVNDPRLEDELIRLLLTYARSDDAGGGEGLRTSAHVDPASWAPHGMGA
jgi:AcrR family transcriptional regulator